MRGMKRTPGSDSRRSRRIGSSHSCDSRTIGSGVGQALSWKPGCERSARDGMVMRVSSGPDRLVA